MFNKKKDDEIRSEQAEQLRIKKKQELKRNRTDLQIRNSFLKMGLSENPSQEELREVRKKRKLNKKLQKRMRILAIKKSHVLKLQRIKNKVL